MNVMRNGVRANTRSARAARVWRGFNRLWLKVRPAQAKAQPAEHMGPSSPSLYSLHKIFKKMIFEIRPFIPRIIHAIEIVGLFNSEN
jgi:hypothetical protein